MMASAAVPAVRWSYARLGWGWRCLARVDTVGPPGWSKTSLEVTLLVIMELVRIKVLDESAHLAWQHNTTEIGSNRKLHK